MKVNTRKQQLESIEKFRVQYKRLHPTFYPKIFIENTDDGYIVWGYESKDSQREIVVSVLDCSDMDFWFFKDMIFGPVAYFLGAEDEEINGYVYFGRMRLLGASI